MTTQQEIIRLRAQLDAANQLTATLLTIATDLAAVVAGMLPDDEQTDDGGAP